MTDLTAQRIEGDDMTHTIAAVKTTAPAAHPFFKEGAKVVVCGKCGHVVIPKLAKHAHGYTHTEFTL